MPDTMETRILCGQADSEMTVEHIVPRWMLRAGSLQSALWAFERPAALAVLSELTTPICKGCNSWLNERCERRAIPLLQDLIAGDGRTLTLAQQRHLARWATKTVLMMDLVTDPVLKPPGELLAFFRHKGYPPPGSMVWIGHVGDSIVRPAWAVQNPAAPSVADLLPRRSISRGLLLGRLFIKYACVAGGGLPAVLGQQWFTTFLNQIYPPLNVLEWPPAWSMDSSAVRVSHEILRPAPTGRRTTQSVYGGAIPASQRDIRKFFDKMSD